MSSDSHRSQKPVFLNPRVSQKLSFYLNYTKIPVRTRIFFNQTCVCITRETAIAIKSDAEMRNGRGYRKQQAKT
ncbi:MAG: hypothetical protein F6J93_01595 [Oscillatoria sp. SIO1A7]|nr:hypothetical protein [Oscillatoria sp. SIO1A7]